MRVVASQDSEGRVRESEQTSSWNARVSQWLAFAVPLLSLTGLISYGILKSAYSRFYGELGLRPEDVGLGYTEILGESLVGLALLEGLLVAISALVLLTLRLMIRAYLRRFEHYEAHSIAGCIGAIASAVLRAILVTVAWWVSIAVFLIGTLFLLLFLVRGAEANGASLRAGRAEDLTLASLGIGQGQVIIISWQAYPATIYWSRDANPELVKRSDGCLMYLGRTGDTTVLYDVTEMDTIRVPTSSLTVVVNSGRRAC